MEAKELCLLSSTSYSTPVAPVSGPFLLICLILFLQIPINCNSEPPFYILYMTFKKWESPQELPRVIFSGFSPMFFLMWIIAGYISIIWVLRTSFQSL